MPFWVLLSSPQESMLVAAIRSLSHIIGRLAPNQCGRIHKNGKGHSGVRIILADLIRRLNISIDNFLNLSRNVHVTVRSSGTLEEHVLTIHGHLLGTPVFIFH